MSPLRPNLTDHEAARILWLSRLYREGKLAAYYDARAEIRRESKGAKFGDKRSIASSHRSSELKKEFGWTGIKDEFERNRTFVSTNVINHRKEIMAEAQRNKGRTALAKAFDELPDNVAYEQEVAWVRAHPLIFSALDRVMRDKEDYSPPKLTVRDLLGRSNGAAPSKGAATQLRFALADPIGWNRRFMDGGKKKAAEGSSGKTGESDAEVVVDDLSDIRQMVASIGKPQQ